MCISHPRQGQTPNPEAPQHPERGTGDAKPQSSAGFRELWEGWSDQEKGQQLQGWTGASEFTEGEKWLAEL